MATDTLRRRRVLVADDEEMLPARLPPMLDASPAAENGREPRYQLGPRYPSA